MQKPKKMLTINEEVFNAFDIAKISIIAEKQKARLSSNEALLELIKNREELLELKKTK